MPLGSSPMKSLLENFAGSIREPSRARRLHLPGGESPFRIAILVATVFLGVWVSCVVAAAQSEENIDKCLPTQLRLEMLEGSHLKFVSHTFSTGLMKYNHMVLRNETGKTILRVLVVVDYLDSDGKLIFSVPYQGGHDDTPLQLMELRAFIRSDWGHPIEPDDTFWLFGTNLEFTRITPATAKVTLVDTKFDDGNSVSGIFPRTEPLLLRAPDFFEMRTDLEKLPDDIWLTLQIDDRGRVGRVEFDGASRLDQDDAEQIRSQLRLWRFFPATAGGPAVPAQMNFRVSFHEKGLPLPRQDCPLNLSDKFPRTYVEVRLQRVDGQKWQARYGGQFVHGDFDTIVSSVY